VIVDLDPDGDVIVDLDPDGDVNVADER